MSGVILALCFPPAGVSVLAFIAFVPVLAALQHGNFTAGEYYRSGYLFGVSFFLVALWWIVDLVAASSITIPWLMFPALALLVAYLSVWPGLSFLLWRKLGRRSTTATLLVLPALWYFSELFRSGSEFGFPWAVTGYAFAGDPPLLQGTAFIGLYGLGAVVVLVNVLWSRALAGGGRGGRIVMLIAGAAIVLAMQLGGRVRIAEFDSEPAGEFHTVAVVQPNVDLSIKWKRAYTDSTFRLIDRLCASVAPLDPELIVFPETAAPIYIHHDEKHRNTMSEIAQRYRTQIYIGFLDGRYEGRDHELHIYNSSGVFDYRDPFGVFRQYDKVHLLPFGEAAPYAWRFPALYKLDFGQANFRPGPWREPLPTRAGPIAPMICFESIFPGPARRSVKEGAEVLVNITNDGWFGDSPGPVQHNDMAIVRAVENKRYLLRSSNTGISMVVDPVGRVVTSLGLFEEGVITARIYDVQGKTFYTRFGNTPVTIACLVLLALGIAAGRLRGAP